MKHFLRTGILASLLFLVTMTMPGAANAAQNYRRCGWPITFSAVGNETMYAPDSVARYYVMNFDTSHQTMTIKGKYPHARFFSFAVYDSPDERPADVAGHLYDQEISPDPGSGVNPFVQPVDGAEGTYTITLSRTAPTSGNVIHVGPDFAWVAMRIYVPSADPTESGNALTGGVPLPTVLLDNQPLEQCFPIQKQEDVRAFFNVLFPPGFDLVGNEGTPTDDRLWFAAPRVTPILLMPNPDNKYIVMMPGDHYQAGRLIVIHGKAPGTPFTYDGSPVWQPAHGFRNVDMRYWSMCNTDFALPIGLVQCTSDIFTARQGGFYTIVMSDDLVRPSWLRPNITWMPYGDTAVPKLVFFRQLLGGTFPFSAQAAWNAGCTFEFNLPNIPDRADVDAAGQCAQQVMGDYYPVATWCDKSTFEQGGWRACMKGE